MKETIPAAPTTMNEKRIAGFQPAQGQRDAGGPFAEEEDVVTGEEVGTMNGRIKPQFQRKVLASNALQDSYLGCGSTFC